MRHIACDTDGCPNQGAPYFDFEPDEKIVLCPHCGHTMTSIPTPDLAPPVAEAAEGDDA